MMGAILTLAECIYMALTVTALPLPLLLCIAGKASHIHSSDTLLCFYFSMLIHMSVRTSTYTIWCQSIIYCPLSIYVLSQASLQICFITSFKLPCEGWLFWEFSLHGVENQQPPPMGNLRTVTYKPFDHRQLDMKSDSSLCWIREMYYVLRKSVTTWHQWNTSGWTVALPSSRKGKHLI